MAQAENFSDDIVKIAKELFTSANERQVPVRAKVTGKIPEWFEGTLLRLGPGKCLLNFFL